MNNTETLDRKYELIAWGLIFVWWGLRWSLLITLPNGTGLFGTGLILLGLNVARSLNGIPIRSTTTRLGILALALGGLLFLASEVFHLAVEIPLFETLLIALGIIFIIEALQVRQEALEA